MIGCVLRQFYRLQSLMSSILQHIQGSSLVYCQVSNQKQGQWKDEGNVQRVDGLVASLRVQL